VKLSTLLQIIGSGSVLMVVGVALILFGAAYGFSAGTGVPLWVSLVGLGLLATVVGIFVIDRGSVEAEEEVKKLPMIDALRSPYLLLGASVVGGLLVARLTRKRPVIVEHATVREIDEEPPVPLVDETLKKTEGLNIPSLVSAHLLQLGAMAGDMAINLGMKSLGIPSMREFLDGILGGEEPKKATPPSPEPVESFDEESNSNVRSRFSMQHAHNGAHRDDFDPLIH